MLTHDGTDSHAKQILNVPLRPSIILQRLPLIHAEGFFPQSDGLLIVEIWCSLR